MAFLAIKPMWLFAALAGKIGFLLFRDDVRMYLAPSIENLELKYLGSSSRSTWDFYLCVDEIRASGLGFQSRNVPLKFRQVTSEGEARRVQFVSNAVRKTRLDFWQESGRLEARLYGPAGRAVRASELEHFEHCLGQPASLPGKEEN
ncbi:hypothetical protein [Altererythrobacter xiamenensis]|uniref:hypothetical protein n=1 Tax=Altererythrobacter xiamenensis TaxID=1316679 RepID=UPI001178725D|nr:hypothetical protein [Altererythrobacter xiamenensis]